MTADAADAFNSVRREKLIWFAPWNCCSCETYLTGFGPAGSSDISRVGLLQCLPAAAIKAFEGPWDNRSHPPLAGLVAGLGIEAWDWATKPSKARLQLPGFSHAISINLSVSI
jgi:hypothetical protein